MDKSTHKLYQRKYFKFLIINFLYLAFLLIYTKQLELSSKKPISNRKLEGDFKYSDIWTEFLLNETNITSENNNSIIDKKSPFFYLSGFYLIFLMMSAYTIAIINRSRIDPQRKEQMKSGILKFLYMANNGALLVSIIFISSVYQISGFAPIGLGLIILTIGTIYYLCNIKGNGAAVLFDNNIIGELCSLPGLMIGLVRHTFECCRCEYYDIVTTTVYNDGTVVKDTCCTSIFCLIWNFYCLMLKIVSTFFTIISYYIFLGLFLLGLIIAKSIYKCCNKGELPVVNNANANNEDNNEDNVNNGPPINLQNNQNNNNNQNVVNCFQNNQFYNRYGMDSSNMPIGINNMGIINIIQNKNEIANNNPILNENQMKINKNNINNNNNNNNINNDNYILNREINDKKNEINYPSYNEIINNNPDDLSKCNAVTSIYKPGHNENEINDNNKADDENTEKKK